MVQIGAFLADMPIEPTIAFDMRLLRACVASHSRCLWFEKGVVRVADRRGSVIAFRTLFIQRGIQADALDEVGIAM